MKSLDDFVGNSRAVEKVRFLIAEAISDIGAQIPDMAFLGPAGHGKNTMANIIAEETGRELLEINSTVINSPMQFRNRLIDGPSGAPRNDLIVHLDECHNLPKTVQDNLLSATEGDRILHTSYKDEVFHDALGSTVSFIFSTTHGGAIRKALRSRLEQVDFLEYEEFELAEMARTHLVALGFEERQLVPQVLDTIAHRARSGRDVVKFARNIKRHQKIAGRLNDTISLKDVNEVFRILSIDEHGLTDRDWNYLKIVRGHNTSVGLESIADLMFAAKDEVKNNIEPWLMKRGYIKRTAGGRILTDAGRELFK